jgi:hypothetical protein
MDKKRLEKFVFTKLFNNIPAFYGNQRFIMCSKHPATGASSNEFSPQPHNIFHKIHFNI